MDDKLKRVILEATGRIHVPWGECTAREIDCINFLTHYNEVTTKGNKREVVYKNGVRILFSYKTPVAGEDEYGFFKTDQYFSSTTSKHITGYVNRYRARTVLQTELDRFGIGD